MSDAIGRDILRQLLAQPVGDDALSRMSRASILAHASQFAEYADIVRGSLLPSRAELDLHLNGASVRAHEANAEQLSRFITKFAKSVQATARAILGREKFSSRLRIAALQPGSVRVTFRAPEVEEPVGAFDKTTETDAIEALALRTITSAVIQAERGDDSLGSSLQALDSRARLSLRKLAQEVADEGWTVTGELRKTRWGIEKVNFTQAAAVRILHATEARETQEFRVPVSGRVDSWSWSTLAVGLKLADDKIVRATVTAPRVQAVVSEMVAVPAVWGSGYIREMHQLDELDSETTRVVRVLEEFDRDQTDVSEGQPALQ